VLHAAARAAYRPPLGRPSADDTLPRHDLLEPLRPGPGGAGALTPQWENAIHFLSNGRPVRWAASSRMGFIL